MTDHFLTRPDIGRFVAVGELDLTLYPDGTREMTPEEIAAWQAEALELEPVTGPYELSKADFISRMTTSEAAAFDGMLQEAGAMFRLTFNLATPLASDSDFFATVRSALLGLDWEEDRVDQLLGRPN